MQSYNSSGLEMSFLMCLIYPDLRKCADSSYTKSVLQFCCLKFQRVQLLGNARRAAVYETSDVITLPFFLLS